MTEDVGDRIQFYRLNVGGNLCDVSVRYIIVDTWMLLYFYYCNLRLELNAKVFRIIYFQSYLRTAYMVNREWDSKYGGSKYWLREPYTKQYTTVC